MVFALDCTESMTRHMLHAIEIAKEVIRGIKEARNIISRFGLVEYRDHPVEVSVVMHVRLVRNRANTKIICLE